MAIMQLDKRIIIVLKLTSLTLVVDIQALLSCRRPPLLDRSSTLVASTVIRRAHKDSDHTAVIAVVH